MKRSRFVAVGAAGLAIGLSLAACSSSGTGAGNVADKSGSAATGGASGTGGSGALPGAGQTITVWEMNGDLTPATLDAINAEFTKKTGAKVNVQLQDWSGITTKLTTALATSNPPDVVDVGNTQVPSYAATGGLADLTSHKDELAQGRTWLGGLVDPATVDGKLYGVPSFAGTRAVIYNKKMWADAGITSIPTTYEELTTDLDKIKAKNTASDFSAFYLPGKYWYAGLQWVWDAGGDIATQSNGSWKAGLSSPEAQQGLKDFKEFQNTYSTPASRTLNTDKPDQDQVFADGKTSAILGNGWEIGVIQKNNPKFTNDDLGTFAFPGKSGKAQPVLLGGSDWSVPVKSAHQDLALEWLKIAAGPQIQDTLVFGKEGWIPNTLEGVKAAANGQLTDIQKGYFTAAQTSKSTPAATNWSTIEGDNSITEFFSSIASGAQTPEAAAKAFDAHIESVLNK
ncbi:MAG: extracellular solute-binding protein [Actinomycetales bacterium]